MPVPIIDKTAIELTSGLAQAHASYAKFVAGLLKISASPPSPPPHRARHGTDMWSVAIT